jgi:hypothetical protein
MRLYSRGEQQASAHHPQSKPIPNPSFTLGLLGGAPMAKHRALCHGAQERFVLLSSLASNV